MKRPWPTGGCCAKRKKKPTPCNRTLREKLIVSKLGKKFSPEVHYRFHKGPILVPILKHINPAHAHIKYFLKAYFMVILLLCPEYYSRLLTKCTAHMSVAHVKP
jgi:hypothetical protein